MADDKDKDVAGVMVLIGDTSEKCDDSSGKKRAQWFPDFRSCRGSDIGEMDPSSLSRSSSASNQHTLFAQSLARASRFATIGGLYDTGADDESPPCELSMPML